MNYTNLKSNLIENNNKLKLNDQKTNFNKTKDLIRNELILQQKANMLLRKYSESAASANKPSNSIDKDNRDVSKDNKNNNNSKQIIQIKQLITQNEQNFRYIGKPRNLGSASKSKSKSPGIINNNNKNILPGFPNIYNLVSYRRNSASKSPMALVPIPSYLTKKRISSGKTPFEIGFNRDRDFNKEYIFKESIIIENYKNKK